MMLVNFIEQDEIKESIKELNLSLIPRVGEIVEIDDINYIVKGIKHKYNISYRIIIIVKKY